MCRHTCVLFLCDVQAPSKAQQEKEEAAQRAADLEVAESGRDKWDGLPAHFDQFSLACSVREAHTHTHNPALPVCFAHALVVLCTRGLLDPVGVVPLAFVPRPHAHPAPTLAKGLFSVDAPLH
jgi:hypothetical protein